MTGSAHPNPAMLPCDADALIQVFFVGRLEALKCLRTRFGVQPVVVPEVEGEVLKHRRLPGVADGFQKAIDKGLVTVLSGHESLRSKLPPDDHTLTRGCQAVWDDIQARGTTYELHVDRGEAYTYAAGVELALPVLTNDGRSIKAMRENRLQTPRTLRVFDLYALAIQTGDLGLSDMGKIRAKLQRANEHVPRAFAHCSFEDGLQSFGVRLVDASLSDPDGADNPLRLHQLAREGMPNI